LKYQNIYQYILRPEENIISKEEWKEFSKDCLKLISINYRKLNVPREDLASNHSIVEDTFCHLLEVINKKIHTFNPEKATFRTWINGYIKKVVLQFSNRYYPFDAMEVSSSDLNKDSEVDIFELLLSIPKSELPDEKLLYQEALDSLRVALDKLPSNWYKVLHYRCVKGYSVEDTAKALNTKKERISNMLNKARERLKIHLEEMGWDIQNYERKAN
jgi:RNA polymerase sigma factor (sigma-70 family)